MRRIAVRGTFVLLCVYLSSTPTLAFAAEDPRSGLTERFANPPRDCRPQTRWWWMGNALTKDDISRQLREMHSQGIAGVEQVTMEPVYEKGDVPYLSPEYFDLLKHAVAEAHRLDMSVSLNFGGPGWVWGGDWVPQEERNQSLLSSSLVVTGPAHIDEALSLDATINPNEPIRSFRSIRLGDRLVAVVAGKLKDGVLDPETFQVVTDRVQGRKIQWDAPSGSWRIMAFWATFPGDGNAVNHIDKKAMEHYVTSLGKKFTDAFGDDLGKEIESLFGDSFEVPILRNGIYWCDSLPAEFRARKEYDLVRNLPALWWSVGSITTKVRYDVNDVLHHLGMEAFFDTFGAWCKAHGVKSRVQPYGFVTDNVEGAGAADIPEMEVTAGEKDAVPWFDTRVGPREYVASGAHVYGRNIVSVEAYTYIHWEPYRATLEELKLASDMFLRSGANRFNNHGFLASPELDIAPTRGFYPAIHISPDNVWWPYYHILSDYIARCCYLLRQGDFCADIAVYSPLANQWALDVQNARRWTRDFDWGDLDGLLISNGYDFDLVNDDALQRMSSFAGQSLKLGAMTYKALVLPNVAAMPLETLRRVEAYAAQGGIVIALERVPEASCGMKNWQDSDREVRAIAARLFEEPVGRNGVGKHAVDRGTTYWIKKVIDRGTALDRRSSGLDPFLQTLRAHVTPDTTIDLAREGLRNNDGLCFIHRKLDDRDIYFVTNVQDRTVDFPVGFRVTNGPPSQWNPYTGCVQPISEYQERDGKTWLPVRLAPYESTFYVFDKTAQRPHAVASSLAWIESVTDKSATGWTDREGAHTVDLGNGRVIPAVAQQVPAPLCISAPWELLLEGKGFKRFETKLDRLVSWTELPDAKHFSGTGVYTAEFNLPDSYVQSDVRLYVDLGVVGNVADVTINGTSIGTVWMRGQRLEITGKALTGANRIEVRTTNTLINRVSGLKEFPDVPEELQPRLGHGAESTRSIAKELLGFEPLPRSGLLGPVEIHPYKRVSVQLPDRN